MSITMTLPEEPTELARRDDALNDAPVVLRDVAGADFDTFFRAHYRDLVGLGYVLTGDRSIAEDLTQEALAKVNQHWERLASYDDPLAWTRRVLANSATSRGRRATTEARLLVRLRSRRHTDIVLPEADDELWNRVRCLPRRQAQAIALHYWNDLTVAQIADVLDIGAESVKTHLTRGRRQLREQLEGGAS